MYSGLNKGDGAVVGPVVGLGYGEVELEEAVAGSSADEVVICTVPREDEEGNVEHHVVAVGACLDASSGGLVWRERDLQLAAHRSVCMGQMTSMLKDADRNSVYARAIEAMIREFIKRENRPPVVLDIGTGTGLLAMLAARAGAKIVYAVEMFDQMAEIAHRVIEDNGYGDKILVIHGKSTEIDQLPEPCDILVSELLDSALLGESVIPSHVDAIRRFLHPGHENFIIPNRASVFVSLIESEELWSMCSIDPNVLGGSNPFRSQDTRDCRGGRALVPVDWKNFSRRGARLLSETRAVMTVDMCGGKAHTNGSNSSSTIELRAHSKGKACGLLVHWTAYLLPPEFDPEEALSYSTAPGEQNWQDHWLQVLCPFPEQLACEEGDVIEVTAGRSDMSLWFSAKLQASDVDKDIKKMRFGNDARNEDAAFGEQCTCGWHLLCGAERILMMNDNVRLQAWEAAITQVVESLDSGSDIKFVVDVSDGSVLSFMLHAKLRNQTNVRVISIENAQFSSIFANQLIEANGYGNSMAVIEHSSELLEMSEYFSDKDSKSPDMEISLLMSECFYYQLHSLPTWRCLSFLYQRHSLKDHMAQQARVIPCRARVMAAAFELYGLADGHGDVGFVEQFNLRCFDDYKGDWTQYCFPYKLGCYEKKILTLPVNLMEFDFDSTESKDSNDDTVIAPFITSGKCHCIAVWVDYELVPGVNLESWRNDDFPPYMKVSVWFFAKPDFVEPNSHSLRILSSFNFGDEDISLSYSISSI